MASSNHANNINTNNGITDAEITSIDAAIRALTLDEEASSRNGNGKPRKTIKLQSIDGKVFEVDYAITRLSSLLSNMLNGWLPSCKK